MGKEWDRALPPKEAFAQMHRVLKSGALAFIMSSPRQDVLWRMLKMLEDCGFQLKQSFVSWIYKSGFPKAYDVSKGIDKKLGKKRKQVVATGGLAKNRNLNDDNWRKIGQDKPLMDANEPTSDLAKKWQGWKSITGLKPALECILMVNKPLSEPTIVDNVLAHGTGAINVDACRIPFEQGEIGNRPPRSPTGHVGGWKDWSKASYQEGKGRFPANLIVSDKALDTGKITKSGHMDSIAKANQRTQNVYGKMYPRPVYNEGDIGDQSRFFDLDAWAQHHGFLDVPKASKQEREFGLTQLPSKVQDITSMNKPQFREKRGRKAQNPPRKNVHPTVKPVKLGAYLVTLGCPPDGVMVDPFCGTGSFLIAAHKSNRKWIGIDNDPETVKIARHRLTVLSHKLTSFSDEGGTVN